MANLNDPKFDELREHPGFCCRRARLPRQVGAERLGLSLWEIPPGQAAYPYHYHLGEEELVVVLSGRLSLRIADSWRELWEAEVVSFLVGEAGAHQIVNRSGEPARMLSFSTSGAPDTVVRPDSGTIGLFERRPERGGLYGHSALRTPSITSRASDRRSPLDIRRYWMLHRTVAAASQVVSERQGVTQTSPARNVRWPNAGDADMDVDRGDSLARRLMCRCLAADVAQPLRLSPA